MARSRKKKSAAIYAKRLADDQYVHEQLREAAGRLQGAYARVSRKRGKAAEDKEVWDHLRQGAGSIRKATLAVRGGRPEPKRRGRKLLVVALAGGGAAVVLNQRRKQEPSAPQHA